MKAYILIVILAALCLSVVNQVSGAALDCNDVNNPESDINFGIALKMFYTSFQRIMPCGYPPLEIPILAPFTLDYYAINMNNGYYGLLGNISDLAITGMNNFRILGATYNTTTNRTSFDVIFPEIQILSEYAMNAMAYLAGYRSEMAGSGLLNVKMIDYRLVGEFSLVPSAQNPNGLRVTDFNLHFYFGDIIFNNWNSLWDISMNNFVNNIAREFILMWTQQIQVQVNEIYAQLVLPYINDVLDEVSMTNLIDFFVLQSMDFDMANCTLA